MGWTTKGEPSDSSPLTDCLSMSLQVATAEKLNPIKQDSKKGKPRSYAIDILWNYGMLPQTWEDPSHASEDCDGHVGDNDPVDVVEIGNKTAHSGDVYAVKPIAAFAMIDEGELDWKIVAISEEDPRCRLVNDVSDMEEHFPGTLDAIREWFRTYKTHDGKPLNEFALGEKAMDREYTMSVVAQTHQFWKDLVSNSRKEGNKVKLAVGDVFVPSSCFDAQETINEGVEKIKDVIQAVVEHQSHKRHQNELEVEHLIERHDSKRVEILSASN